MTSIGRPALSRSWWESACPEAIESRHLATALSTLERTELKAGTLSSAESAGLLSSSLSSVEKALERTRRELDRREHSDVLSALADLAKQIAQRRDEVDAKAKDDAPEEEAEDASDEALLDAERARKLLRRLPKGPMPFAFGVGEGGATYLVLDRSRKGAALMSKLKDASGCTKATFGIASVEGKELCLDVHGPKLGSMRQRVREFLRENQPMPYAHVRVMGAEQDDGDEPADDGDEPTPSDAPHIEQTDPNVKRYALGEDSDVEVEEPKSYALGEDSDVEDDEPKRYAMGEDTYDRKQPAPSPAPAPQDDQPLNMVRPYEISQSVGAGGKNGSDDVQQVQIALNRRGADLEVDGQCGPLTIAAIKNFQRLMGFSNPDGLIEPGKYTDRALAGEKVHLPKQPPYKPQPKQEPRERRPREVEEPYDPSGGERIRPRTGYTVDDPDPAEIARELARRVLESKKAADRRMEELKRAAAERAGEEAGRIVQKIEELYERGAESARGVSDGVRDLTQRAFEADQETGRRVREDQVEALRKAAELAERGFDTVASGVEKGLRWLESQDGEE